MVVTCPFVLLFGVNISLNPEVIKELHAWADKNEAEMKKMMTHGDHYGHEGHGH